MPTIVKKCPYKTMWWAPKQTQPLTIVSLLHDSFLELVSVRVHLAIDIWCELWKFVHVCACVCVCVCVCKLHKYTIFTYLPWGQSSNWNKQNENM